MERNDEQYDDTKDEVLAEKQLQSENSDVRGYMVKLVRRSGGKVMVQINSYWIDAEGGMNFNKLGRIRIDWFVRIAKAVKEMKEELNI